MAVRVADFLKQQNDLDTFPVAYGADIWLDKKKGVAPANYKSLQAMYNDDELGGGGSIQVETMPTASDENVGKIVQYVGESGTYQKGHFYECILAHNDAGSIYAWEDVDHLRFNHVVYQCTVPPINGEYKPGDIIYYSGNPMGNFKKGYFYRAIPTATPQQHYGATLLTASSIGIVYFCYTPFELRIGFIVYPTGTGGESTPYQITDFDDTGITITPYGWTGEERHYVGASYTKTVGGWEELEGGGGTSIFYGTMEEWNALSTEEKKQYDYMTDDDAGGNYTDTYSTNEVKTNKVWVDGKPIYRKVVSLPTAKNVSDSSYIDLGITFPSNADTMFLPEAVSVYGNLMYYNNYRPIQAACKVNVDLASGTNFILEYTKTTD